MQSRITFDTQSKITLSQILSLAENIENILSTHPQGLHFNLPLNGLGLAIWPGCQE